MRQCGVILPIEDVIDIIEALEIAEHVADPEHATQADMNAIMAACYKLKAEAGIKPRTRARLALEKEDNQD